MNKFLFLLATLLFSNTSFAVPGLPYEVPIILQKAYVPKGYDNNDKVQIVVEGHLPSTCYRLTNPNVKVDHDKKLIQIEQKAFLYVDKACLQLDIPFRAPISIGLLNDGTYKIESIRTEGQKVIQTNDLDFVPISIAKNAGPDDYMYAIVDDFTYDKATEVGVIKGKLPNSCFEVVEVRVIVESKDVVSILPIIEQKSETCVSTVAVNFEKEIEMPKLIGPHLINVRSLNGLAVNKVFDF